MARSVWLPVDIPGLGFLFAHPEQYKYRIFPFLPCGRNGRCDPECSYKRQNSVVNCGANRTCFQPCSKLVLPLRPATACAAAAVLSWLWLQRRQEEKQRHLNVFIPWGNCPRNNCLLAEAGEPGGELPFVSSSPSRDARRGEGREGRSSCPVPAARLFISLPNCSQAAWKPAGQCLSSQAEGKVCRVLMVDRQEKKRQSMRQLSALLCAVLLPSWHASCCS